jgi:hypothetical protein
MEPTAAIWTNYNMETPTYTCSITRQELKLFRAEPVVLMELSCPINFPTAIAHA